MEKKAKHTPKKLGEFMRVQREARNMGIEAMARCVGVNKNTLGGYERSERLPDIEFLAEFALATDSDFQQLLALRLNGSKAPAVHKSLGLLGLINTQRDKGNQYTLQETALDYNLDADGLRKHLIDVSTQALHSDRQGDNAPEAARSRRSDDEYTSIPSYGVATQDSRGDEIHSDDKSVVDALVFKRAWIRTELHAQPADLLLMYVDGDSMEARIRSGDVVLLDRRDTTAQRDGVYVLRLDGALLIKRLQRLPGGSIEVTSENEAYKPFTIALEDLALDFTIIGRVVWVGGRL
ncbi:MAG: LexA family transcriptional regulator [Gammaproteobacteria bacterium]